MSTKKEPPKSRRSENTGGNLKADRSTKKPSAKSDKALFGSKSKSAPSALVKSTPKKPAKPESESDSEDDSKFNPYDYRLFVKNIDCSPFTTSFLRTVLEKHGNIIKATIGKNNFGKLKNTGDVIFTKPKAVLAVIESADSEGKLETENGSFYVRKSEKQTLGQRPARGIFFRGLPEGMKKKDFDILLQLFEPYGEVEKIYVNKDKFTGSVLYQEGESGAKLLTAYREDNDLIKVNDAPLSLFVFSKQRKQQRRNN